jgi:hypothetical protein
VQLLKGNELALRAKMVADDVLGDGGVERNFR